MQYLFTLIVTLGWLLLLAFFASGEIVVMALDSLRLETEARQGSISAKRLKALRANPQRFLTTMLIGNNIASMSLAAFFTSQCLLILGGPERLGMEGATLFSAVIMIVVQTIFGELVPKTLAAVITQRLSRMLAWPLTLTTRLFTPFSMIIDGVTQPLIRILAGGKTQAAHEFAIADLYTALSIAHARGELHRTEVEVASEALDFAAKTLGDVMTPRVDIIGVIEHASVGEALTLMTQTGYSRLPVYRESLDEITGILMLKDLVRVSLQSAENGLDPDDLWARSPASEFARQPAFFPIMRSIVETLSEMRQMRVHLAIVVDEHGGTAGLVSLEDILEELVGDIRDETDADSSADVIRRGEDYVIATGRARVDSLPEFDDLDRGDSDVTTVGGLLMERLGRAAAVGDAVTIGDVRITALKVIHNQIKLMRIERVAPEQAAARH